MKCTILAALAAASLSADVRSQWDPDPLQNTTVRDGNGVTAATPLMSDGPGGSTYISWFDQVGGNYELHMQLLDVDGNALWPAAGLVVSSQPQNSALFRYDLKTDNLGNAIVAFQDERSGHLDIVAYKIDPAGNQLWTGNGLALTDPASTQGLSPVIGVMTSNDVIIAWSASSATDRWIAYQWISAGGTPQWASPHQVNGTANYSRAKVVPCSNAGYILQYVEETGNFPFVSDLYAQRYTFDGTPVWASPVHVSTKTISAFHFPEPVTDGHDGFYLPFNTSNPNNAALTDVYVQRLRGNGTLWSPTGTELLTGTATQRYGGSMAVLNDIMGLMVPVQVTNTGQSQGGWNVQRLDTAGTAQLGPAGTEIVAPSAQLAAPVDAASTSDGLIVVYSEGGFGQVHLRAVRVGFQGNTVWAAPVDLSAVNSNKDDASCGMLNNNGQVVAVWQDDRLGSGIYAQNVTLDGNLGPLGIAASSPGLTSMTVRTDAGRTVLMLDGTWSGPASLLVIDGTGRMIRQERIVIGRDLHTIPLSLSGAAAGSYTVVLATSDRRSFARWVMR